MKAYCIQFEECGHFSFFDEKEEDPPQYCSECNSLMLIYENNQTPLFIESTSDEVELEIASI